MASVFEVLNQVNSKEEKEMKTIIVNVDPIRAREWLSRNIENNRHVNLNLVHKYASDMKAGSWKLTHQGIAFDQLGSLIDGQHRLYAIIESGVTVPMLVAFDVMRADGDVLPIDTGGKRSDKQIFAMCNISDPVIISMAPVVRYFYRFSKGLRNVSPDESKKYIQRHYAIFEKLAKATGYAEGQTTGCRHDGTRTYTISAFIATGLLCALYRGLSDDALTKFCAVYRRNDVDGCDNYNYSAVINLRDYLRYARTSDLQTFMRVKHAIKLFESNKTRMKMIDHYPYNELLDC